LDSIKYHLSDFRHLKKGSASWSYSISVNLKYGRDQWAERQMQVKFCLRFPETYDDDDDDDDDGGLTVKCLLGKVEVIFLHSPGVVVPEVYSP
jgi:hypothetical protein